MKLKFKKQKFQADAADAVVDVFKGQPYLTPKYLMDFGKGVKQLSMDNYDFTGWSNSKIIPELNDRIILDNLNKIQRINQIEPSKKLEKTDGTYNLTIEMETGVGKTYTYTKTMYELNKHYGWTKFIVVVPSIAIREGVYKSFEVTQEHFAEEYGKKIRFFIYNSSRLAQIDRFASDNNINVMIINSQAFNSDFNESNKDKPKNKIFKKLDSFNSRRPIDVIAKTNPILIIDEPQSVEGKQTKKNLKEFNSLLTLRYSATHRKDAIYNMVYRLDAVDAFNKKLVKKISVKGISQSGDVASDGFVYLERINTSKGKNPTATIQFDLKGKSGLRKVIRTLNIGDNLYSLSNELEEYKDRYVIRSIDGRENSVEFINGIKIYASDVIGEVNEDVIRRIQIRETILSHIERERTLFYKGIKVLSLFFIDEVAKYKQYDDANMPFNGEYAKMFEEEYNDIVNNLQTSLGDNAYIDYLNKIDASSTHAGYFSIDKKGKMIDSKAKKKENYCSDDVDAYDLIMKNKELLLDLDPKKSPVRFIFSHSALREGWDNPNVFQICTLKQSSSEVRKRQEVGRGLRLCVNDNGERMDENVLGLGVHEINKLTVIASDSYDSFARSLQEEIAEAVAYRPRIVNVNLFINRVITNENGYELTINERLATTIVNDLRDNGYIDREGGLTEKYYADVKKDEVIIAPEVEDSRKSIIDILNRIYDEKSMKPENALDNNVEIEVDEEKLNSKEFKALWKRINKKTYYTVDFETDELVKKSISALNQNLHVPLMLITVEQGSLDELTSKDTLLSGEGFVKSERRVYNQGRFVRSSLKYDLIGKIVENTGLTRKAIVKILTGITPMTFEQFKVNPEEFIIRASNIINDEKATAIIQHISYDLLEEEYDTTIFTEKTLKGKYGENVVEAKKSIYSHVLSDSQGERDFAHDLDVSNDVAVYVKLPSGFYISTPVGKYNPDWAIAFYEDGVKHIYFVAETKGSMRSMELREIEKSKIHCAKEHFKKISGDDIKYEVVDSYKHLMEIVRG